MYIEGGHIMDNNDILVRLRYALDIRDVDMIKIFEFGGIKTTKEEVGKILNKSKEKEQKEIVSQEDIPDSLYEQICSNEMIESFLNGFVTFKRGRREIKPGQYEEITIVTKNTENVNNLLLKKVKIGLELTSDDIKEILDLAGVKLSNSELSALFRKVGHKNYRICGDKYARNFLKGLTIKYRTRT